MRTKLPGIEPPTKEQLQELLNDARERGQATVSIVFGRKTKISAGASTIRLYGSSGPASSEDAAITWVDKANVEAVFRVSDLAVYLRERNHKCHAIGCDASCKPEHLMCTRHWGMVPGKLQVEVYRAYRVGQCQDQEISRKWLVAAKTAIARVALREHKITDDQAKHMVARAKAFEGSDGQPSSPYDLLAEQAVAQP